MRDGYAYETTTGDRAARRSRGLLYEHRMCCVYIASLYANGVLTMAYSRKRFDAWRKLALKLRQEAS